MVPCWDSRTPPEAVWCIHNWEDYCCVRGFPGNSPVPMLMHYALSVYFALLLKRHISGSPTSGCDGHIEICYLGPEVEMKILPVFFELGCLLADYNLDIHLIGPEVPEVKPSVSRMNPTTCACPVATCSCHQSASTEWVPLKVDLLGEHSTAFFDDRFHGDDSGVTETETRLHFHRGLYHDCLTDHRPDLVFCPNAGIEVYDSWRPSLERIVREGTFSVFTDYTEEAIHRSEQFCRSMGVFPSFAFVNPFHCPVSNDRGGIRVPCFSNGFGFVLNGQ